MARGHSPGFARTNPPRFLTDISVNELPLVNNTPFVDMAGNAWQFLQAQKPRILTKRFLLACNRESPLQRFCC